MGGAGNAGGGGKGWGVGLGLEEKAESVLEQMIFISNDILSEILVTFILIMAFKLCYY